MRNIILVTFDSLRADHCGYMGYERDTTPNLDQMSEEGTTFRNAISPASRTNPSMASTFTGEHMVFREQVSNSDVSQDHLKQHGTLAEDMSEKGYSTGAFNPNAYASRYYGFNRGFDHYEDFFFSSDTYQSIFDKHLSESGIFGTLRNLRNFARREEVFRTWESYINNVVTWIEDQQEPFFLWMFSLETHFPYLTPRNHRKHSNIFDQYFYNWICNRLISELDPDVSDKTWEKIIDIYDDSIRFADALLGELRDRLSDFDPIIVVHGDHGEAFGEHDIYGHFYPSLHKENVEVPFVVWNADTDSRDVDQPISLLDIPDIVQHVGRGESLQSYTCRSSATASDYDGRNNRDLVSRSIPGYRIISERKDGGIEHTYETDGQESIGSELQKELGKLTELDFQHEDELTAIQEAVNEFEEI